MKCTRCNLDLPDDQFTDVTRSRAYKTCSACRNATYVDTTTRRQCAGTPKKKCKKLITDYRCQACWREIRHLDTDSYHANIDHSGIINLKGY